jgi:hypothetical protein
MEIAGEQPEHQTDGLPGAGHHADQRGGGAIGREVRPDDAARALVDDVPEGRDHAEKQDEAQR